MGILIAHSGIYKITNNITNNIYIGKAKNIEHRWSEHKSEARTNKNNNYLHNSIRKYGENNFSIEIIEEIPLNIYDKTSADREKYWIKYYNSFTNVDDYNLTEGGDGVSGWHPSEELKKQNSKQKKEWYTTEAGLKKRQQQSKMLKNNPLPHNLHTEEWKQNHSKQMMGENNPNYGKHTRGKRCYCVELDKYFESTRSAALELNLNSHNGIAKVCRGEQHTAYGYHWKYVD